jgi:AcrR family transcriptional regulator
MGKRAADVEHTRRRIVEATVELHRSEGLDASYSDIAARAGVTRATLYRHFPDTESLFQACSAHWIAEQVPPDPHRWTGNAPPARLRAALTDVYRYYAEGADMLRNVERARPMMPAALADEIRRDEAALREALLGALPRTARHRPRVAGVVGHVLAFSTWHSLVLEHGVARDDAVELMARLVEAAQAEDDALDTADERR